MLLYIFPATAATVIYIRSACAHFGNIDYAVQSLLSCSAHCVL